MNTVDFEATKPEAFIGKTLPELVDELYPNIELNIIATHKGTNVMTDINRYAKKWPEIMVTPIDSIDVKPLLTYQQPGIADNFVKYDVVVTFDDAKK